MRLATKLAQLVHARINCAESGNADWEGRHIARIESLVSEHMPSGSGYDSGTTLDLDKSTGEKLVFVTSFHHMNDSGMYDGWTEHNVIVTPSLAFGFNLKVTGKDRNDIKDYMAECFSDCLHKECE